MTRTNQLTSPHLRPPTADLNRLLAGEHHDPHSILGAHEYGDHTVIRAYRPHAVEVAALVGGERYVFQHIESGPVRGGAAVHEPGRLPAGGQLRRRRRFAGCPRRGRCVPVPAHAGRGRPAPVRRGPPRTTVGDPRRASAQLHHARRRRGRGVVRGVGAERQGRQPDRRVQPLGRQRGPVACAGVDGRVGVVLARTSRSAGCTSSGYTVPTVRSPTAPTRWRSPPRCRRRRRRG